MFAEEKCKNSPTVLVWCSTVQLPSGLLEISALSPFRKKVFMGQRNPYSGLTPKSDSAHGTGPLSSSTKNSPIHYQSLQARLPLGHHRWGRLWKTTTGACLHSAFHKHPTPQSHDFWAQGKAAQLLQKPVCPSFTPPLYFAKSPVLILGAPLTFRYHHQEYFQLLMGSQPPADEHKKESSRLLEKAEGYICFSPGDEYLSHQATQGCHCHKTACKRLFQKLWILMAPITLTSLLLHQGRTWTVPRTRVSMRVNHPLTFSTFRIFIHVVWLNISPLGHRENT